MNSFVTINEKDNVRVALKPVGDIPAGHKIAVKDIKEGEPVIKYGEVIGRATKDIKAGEWVHSHNLKSHLNEEFNYSYSPNLNAASVGAGTFSGYKRSRGRAGVRNEIYIIPTVGCVNDVCRRLEKLSAPLIEGSVDGVFALTHQFGCSQLGTDGENIKKLLVSVALNPNASFVLFVGLGCENNALSAIKAELDGLGADNIEYFNCQEIDDEIAYGLQKIKKFISAAKDYAREEILLSELTIGLKCGGSDGFSGITANPIVGKIADKIVGAGGGAVLTEVPEMFGAEQILMNKCADEETFLKYKKMIVDFKDYYIKQGFPVYENPSPGNKAGGITTLEEKSLGCVEKAGSTPIVDVLEYGERVKRRGVSVLNAPGNDLIAATALAAAGCQIVLFTTGRGTPFSTFVPTLKIASNEEIAVKKSNWVDFCAYNMSGGELYDLVIKTASGLYKAKSEDIREIAFFKTGVTL